jgi:hypothetical protein
MRAWLRTLKDHHAFCNEDTRRDQINTSSFMQLFIELKNLQVNAYCIIATSMSILLLQLQIGEEEKNKQEQQVQLLRLRRWSNDSSSVHSENLMALPVFFVNAHYQSVLR